MPYHCEHCGRATYWCPRRPAALLAGPILCAAAMPALILRYHPAVRSACLAAAVVGMWGRRLEQVSPHLAPTPAHLPAVRGADDRRAAASAEIPDEVRENPCTSELVRIAIEARDEAPADTDALTAIEVGLAELTFDDLLEWTEKHTRDLAGAP